MSLSPSLLIILVNYFNESETIQFIRQQLLKQNDADFNVLIIDNGSNNQTELNEFESSRCKVISPEKNLGYFGAADFGLKTYLQNNSQPDGVVLSNPDISFTDAEFISSLKKKIIQNEFDVMGPDITSAFLHQKQNPYIRKRISRRKLKTIHWLTSNFILYNLFLIVHFFKTKVTAVIENEKKSIANLPVKVYGVHGSFMVFHKNYFQCKGSFEYPAFLFGEEIFVAEVCRINNLNVIFDPSLKIVHYEHATTGIFKKKKFVRYIHESYEFLLDRFFKE